MIPVIDSSTTSHPHGALPGRLGCDFGLGDHRALLDNAARTVIDRQFDPAKRRQDIFYHILPSRRYLFQRQLLGIGRLFPVEDSEHGLFVGYGRPGDQRTAHLPILGDGIQRDVVLLRKTILLVNVTLEIAGTVPCEGLVERPGPVGRRIARDFDRFDMHQRIAHEVVHKGVQSVKFARIAVERRGKAGQVDLVTDRIIRVALTLHKEPADDVIAVGGLRQHHGVGRRRRHRAPGPGRRSGSGTQRKG